MAIEEMDDNDNDDVGSSKKQGSNVMKIVLIVLLIVVLMAGSIGATLYFSGVFSGGANIEQATSTDVSEIKPKKKIIKPKKDTIYFPFEPSFVVNFNDGKSIRYLQLTIEVMTNDASVVDDVETHMPVIRNNLIMMFSNLNYETINSVSGKRKLQNEALTEIRSILLDKTGREGVEEVYFTGFVMQ